MLLNMPQHKSAHQALAQDAQQQTCVVATALPGARRREQAPFTRKLAEF